MGTIILTDLGHTEIRFIYKAYAQLANELQQNYYGRGYRELAELLKPLNARFAKLLSELEIGRSGYHSGYGFSSKK